MDTFDSGRSGERTSVNGRFVSFIEFDDISEMVCSGNWGVLCARRYELVQQGAECEASAEEVCKQLSAFNRSVIRAVLEMHSEDAPWLAQCTFMEFGSGGRDEQILGSDQDNGLLLHTFVDRDHLEQVTQSIVVSLDAAGLPLCGGEVMVNNVEWRGDFDTWCHRLIGWLSNPIEKGPWQSGLIFDFKAVFGSEPEVVRLREKVWEYVRTKPVTLSLLIGELTEYRLPLSFWGAFITEKEGPWQGCLNLKKSILTHIIKSIRILALKYGLHSHNTCDRLRLLVGAGHIERHLGEHLLKAWEFLQGKRLEIGLSCFRHSIPYHGYLDPSVLDGEGETQLKETIHTVAKFVERVQAGDGL
ncbi:putative nucleotidyltransferase substrate binding domain-containing protein [Pseudodesulfovibrio piezophilus]|uniref:Uncharacterized protein n=1 Tax=Pseudodesulfovibrio piezophilus (strain DSM 21447 / JCM 15486 / C1TLV30) TaxID=1322246 RepID=M1WPT5_PSEP2|nr:putative nucleotidyltransferase substrate binding domain-containing protein [Pseudodesulfovibrio piezophilus]CCH47282.1 conserved protein of unknown function [Pseudodesulfovibrio piezophilus C1TLV30]